MQDFILECAVITYDDDDNWYDSPVLAIEPVLVPDWAEPIKYLKAHSVTKAGQIFSLLSNVYQVRFNIRYSQTGWVFSHYNRTIAEDHNLIVR